MKFLQRTFVGVATCFAASAAVAQHNDIVLEVHEGRLVTVNDATGLASRVFTGTLGQQGVPGYTDNPGYSSGQLAPGSLVGFNATAGLLFWDGVALVAAPEDEALQILLNGTPVLRVDSADGFQDGVNFAQAGGGGGIHQHLQFWVRHPDFDSGDPFNNPISVGAYVLFLEQTSSVHATSEEYAIVFNHTLGNEEFEDAVQAVRDLFEPTCPVDLDGDGVVGLSDLAIVLANYGTSSGATPSQGDTDNDGDVDLEDLATLLGAFGGVC